MEKRSNNFDLLRLLAAFQVVYGHVCAHLQVSDGIVVGLGSFLSGFPGVTVFFAISGFLVFQSFDRAPVPKRFYKNRFLRIYPGLWVALLFTCLLLAAFGVLTKSNMLAAKTIAWLAAQATFFQVYTPAALRTWGCHVPNGSLWTIILEVQFYLCVPFLHLFLARDWKLRLCVLMAGCACVTLCSSHLMRLNLQTRRIAGAVVLPYLFNFVIGLQFYKAWNWWRRWVENRFIVWLALYLIYFCALHLWLKWYTPSYWPNVLGLIGTFLLCTTAISFAHSFDGISDFVLRGTDLSYGVYVYHMLVVNSMIALGFTGKVRFLPMAMLLAVLCAVASWFLVEKPALGLKYKSFNTDVRVAAIAPA
jgi:peptidoglycan/LPS O-acetylase OafA/YrhL